MAAVSPPVTTFFPTIEGNLTKITWAHAVNNSTELNNALAKADIMMLEADIVLGTLNDDSSTEQIPIMGHPPANKSDLSLEQFINTVAANGKKGVKLDFKTTEVFNQSLSILAKLHKNMTFPVWLNADILPGPVNATANPVDARSFLTGAHKTFPESTLSIGWTTRYGSADNITEGTYTSGMVQRMVDIVSSSNITQSITYPVRAAIVVNSISEMQDLLNRTSANNPTLTIWTGKGDDIDTDKLSTFIKTVGVSKVYIDLPEHIIEKLDISGAMSLRLGAMTITALVLNLAIAMVL
ncbi:protein FAM151B isoform X2 [Cephus cinctus]|nr:protein FAM151B isoform X2 [Cephus cinctus]XP_015598600.1 protein FAM151B isoform X2 [Cephus cinctus]XP_015598601.1 protein FAM151B isoform X2 [Cephus cinctus]XP_015598602.1 protein FAM151B isoform X2 [Cephus cinctus]